MKHIFQLLLFFLISPCLQLQAATHSDQFITVTLPQTVIQSSIERILPLTFDVVTDQVEGIITIEKISNLKLKEQLISAQILLHGDNVVIKTMIGSQEIRLQLGSATTDFACDAALRYNAAKQTLYIRPLPHDLQPEESLKKGDLGEALLLLLNGREFPIELKDIQPIIAETSNKLITIQTRVADVRSTPQSLKLMLSPEISSTP
jgi:hypothetical protein